jgi:signal transduction histidine kinase
MTLWILAISLVIQLTVGVVVLLYQRAAVVSYFDGRLARGAQSIAESLRDTADPVTDRLLATLAEERLPDQTFQQFLIAVYRPDGTLVASSMRPAPPHADVVAWADAAAGRIIAAPIPALDTSEAHDPARATVLRIGDPTRGPQNLLLVAVPGQLAAAMLWLAARALMVVVPVGAVASGLAGWLIAGLALRPLRELGAVAESMMPEAIDDPVALRPVTSETAEVQRQLEDARTRLRTALHAQDRFISNVSHELKTPVAVLLTEAQTLDQGGLSEDQRTFVTSVIEEMRRLGRMVESFLTLTHLRAGKAVTNVRRCSLNDLVMESITACGSMARQYSVRVEPHLEEQADPGVDGNTELLRIMVDNLVRNAIRFAPERSPVLVTVGREGPACTVRVRDLGPGLPPEVIDKLFDRYTEPGTASSRGRGYGLGLSIAQGIAELHGGKISARNEPTGGCLFEVRLPASGPAPAPAGAPPVTAASTP